MPWYVRIELFEGRAEGLNEGVEQWRFAALRQGEQRVEQLFPQGPGDFDLNSPAAAAAVAYVQRMHGPQAVLLGCLDVKSGPGEQIPHPAPEGVVAAADINDFVEWVVVAVQGNGHIG